MKGGSHSVGPVYPILRVRRQRYRSETRRTGTYPPHWPQCCCNLVVVGNGVVVVTLGIDTVGVGVTVVAGSVLALVEGGGVGCVNGGGGLCVPGGGGGECGG